MFKINNLSTASQSAYAEEGQPNSLRWLVLHRTAPQEFVPNGHWIKCKDFFNDLVFAYQTGHKFSVFGFNTTNMKVPVKGEPLFMLLKAIEPTFLKNIAVMNEWLVSQGCPVVTFEKNDEDQVLIAFDPFYLANTYNISLISLIIRLMNSEKQFASFAEAQKYKGFHLKDQQKWNQVVAKKVYFNIPEKMKKYVWFQNADYNSEKPFKGNETYMIHNSGVLCWSNFL